MAGFDLFGSTHRLLAASLHLRSTRHSVLTANVTNADTPGYRPRDVQFASVLQAIAHSDESVAAPAGGLTLVSTNPHHQQAPDSSLYANLDDAVVTGGEALDRNQVDLDGEITRLVENTLQHEASLTLLSRTLGGLRYAISEGRR
jgi:flagellar basal-body rod protein FlgB